MDQLPTRTVLKLLDCFEAGRLVYVRSGRLLLC